MATKPICYDQRCEILAELLNFRNFRVLRELEEPWQKQRALRHQMERRFTLSAAQIAVLLNSMPERHFEDYEVYEFFEKQEKEYKESGYMLTPPYGIRSEDRRASTDRDQRVRRLREKELAHC